MSKHFSTPLSSARDSFVGTLGFEVNFVIIMTNYTTSRKLIENKYQSYADSNYLCTIQ